MHSGIKSILERNKLTQPEAHFVALMACGRSKDEAAKEAGLKYSGAELLQRPHVRAGLRGLADLNFGLLDED